MILHLIHRSIPAAPCPPYPQEIAGHLQSTSVHTAGHFTAEVPRPREFAIHKEKKGKFAGVSRGRGRNRALLELTDAL